MAVTPQGTYSLLAQDVATTVVNAATATGTAKSYIFTIPAHVGGQAQKAGFAVSGTFTVGTVTLQAASDGTNYSTYSTADTGIDVAANKFFTLNDLLPGWSYKFTVATITGTFITISGVVS